MMRYIPRKTKVKMEFFKGVTLSDILVAAVNEAIKRVEDTNSAEMSKITGNVGMPGLF